MSDRITSSANVHVKRAAALLSKPKMRREERAFVVEGLRLFLDTPESFIEEVFLTDSAAKESEALREKAAASAGAFVVQKPVGYKNAAGSFGYRAYAAL